MDESSNPLRDRIAGIHEAFMAGHFDEVEYTERVRMANAAAKPDAWQRYVAALAYCEYMRDRGFYESEAAYQRSREIAWEQYLDAPIDRPQE